MRCVLTTELVVEKFAVFAEVARLERRPELGVLCRGARSAGRRISTEVVQQLLPGVSRVAADNILVWCRTLRLCDDRGTLTELGERVADSDEAPVPEQGVFALWVASHPLLGNRVLHLERLTSTRDVRFESIVPLPITPDRNVPFQSLLEPEARYVLRELLAGIGGPGCIRQGSSRCRLRWTLDFDAGRNQWQLEGSLSTGERTLPIQHTPESVVPLDLWKLFERWANLHLTQVGQWQPELRRLAVSFDKLPDASQEAFTHAYPLSRVEVPGKGTYEQVRVEDVPICPRTRDDAQRWARARLDRALASERAYRTRSDVRRLFVSLVEETPLAPLQPTLPDHDTLVSEVRRDPTLFWGLAAAVDLAPFPVDAGQLAALTVGTEVVRTAPIRAERNVRIPYASNWSMRELVEALLDGARPRRVLLCERYVRGESNLHTLELLMNTLRTLHPAAQLEVVTENEPGNTTQSDRIRTITGRPPRFYKDMFGQHRRNQLHGRYLLVEPDSGSGFGWQMDNSPLHARPPNGSPPTPQSPLRWKDLLAYRLEQAELAPDLGRWLEGGAR